MNPYTMNQIPCHTHSIIPGWGWDPEIVEKIEKKFFRELTEVCNQTHEELHGKSSRVAKEILGYESIFGLEKGTVL